MTALLGSGFDLAGDARVWGFVLLVLAGFISGVVNAIAGGGSFLTLPVLTALGLPAGVANGSVRVSILPQNATILATFWRRGVRVPRQVWALALPICVGAFGGSALAARMDDALLQPVFGGIFVVWAVILVIKPSSFREPEGGPRPVGAMSWVFAALIGIYGGFMQAGVGFPLLALLVGQLGLDPVRANAAKAALVALYSVIALVVFAAAGKVAWMEAGVLTVATMLGGWVGTRWQLRGGAELVRWFVVVMVVVSGVVMLWRGLS